MDSVRSILAIAAKEDLDLIHFDVKTAFLHGELKEDIRMEQPEGFADKANYACHLKKSLYGLKQASRAWNECFLNFLRTFGLRPLKTDPCVLTRDTDKSILIIAIYVDDGLAASNDTNLLSEVVQHLKRRFEMTIMPAECFVGLIIERDRKNKKLKISQKPYIDNMVKKFELEDCKHVASPIQTSINYCRRGVSIGPGSRDVQVPYREAIGSIMYAMTGTRPDIAYAVSLFSRFSEKPKLPHWIGVKRILRYLKDTSSVGIVYDGSRDSELVGYCDADFVACRDSRKSVSGTIVKLSSAPIMWKSTKQSTVAESTAEAEFVACCALSKDIVWARNFISEIYGKDLDKPTTIYSDNQSAISLIRNNQNITRVKHLDIKLFAVKEREETEQIKVQYINTTEQQADILTKAIMPKQFIQLRTLMGLAMMLMLLCTMGADAYVKFDFGKPFGEKATAKLILKVNNPCLAVEQAENAALNRTKIEFNTSSKLNALLMQASKTYCNHLYDNVIVPELRSLDECVVSREKRDIGAIVSAVTATAHAVIGVTNLIKGSSEPASIKDKDSVINELTKVVESETKMALANRALMSSEEQQDMAIVSPYAYDHKDELVAESENIPMTLWQLSHSMHEIHAGSANIRAILKHCKNAQLATHEVGEMMEYEELMDTDPEDTKLKSIQINEKENEVTIIYEEEKSINISLTIIVAAILSFVLVTYMVYLLIIGHQLMERKRQRIAQDVESGTTRSRSSALRASWDN